MQVRINASSAKMDQAQLEQLKAAADRATAFKLRLGPDGRVALHDLTNLLIAARSSPHYRSHSENYQFKLKQDRQGQYLTLKQQGKWSSFKGWLHWGSDARKAQRAAARDLINTLVHPKFVAQADQNRLTNEQARLYQQQLRDTMGVLDSRKVESSRNAGQADSVLLSKRNPQASGEYTFEALIQSEAVQESSEGRASAMPISDSPDVPKQVPADKKQPVHGSYELRESLKDDGVDMSAPLAKAKSDARDSVLSADGDAVDRNSDVANQQVFQNYRHRLEALMATGE